LGITKCEIWVDDFIRKVSLEELAQSTIVKRNKAVWFVEKEGRKILLSFFLESSYRVLDNGTHFIKRAVTGVLFTEVKEYKRMIVFDHCRGKLLYTNDITRVKGDRNTYIIPVLRYPDEIVEVVTEAIFKKGYFGK